MLRVHYTVPARSDTTVLAGIVNSTNEKNGVSGGGSTGPTGPTGPSGSGLTGPTGPAGGGGSSLQKGLEIIATSSNVVSYTGTFTFDTPFSTPPIVVGSTSVGTLNITDTQNENFSYSLSTVRTASTFTVVNSNTSFNYAYSRLTIINSNPAVILIDGNGDLSIERALDTSGTSWPVNPTIIDTSIASFDQRPGTNIVNNFPVVSYYDGINLSYISSLDINGATWGTSMVVDNTLSQSGQDFSSIGIVNGNPAIAYYFGSTIRYAYSTVAVPTSASDWSRMTVVTATLGASYSSPELRIVGGNPAMVYYTTTGVFMVRSTIVFPTQDTDWGAPVEILNGSISSISFEIVNSKPAVVTWLSGNIKYLSSDDNGATWNLLADIPVATNDVPYVLKVIGTIPNICYTNVNIINGYQYSLFCVQSQNSSGTLWGEPFLLSSDYRVDLNIQVIDDNGLNVLFYNTLGAANVSVYMSSLINTKLFYIAA